MKPWGTAPWMPSIHPMMGSGESAKNSRDALLKKIAIIEKLSWNSRANSTKPQTKPVPVAKVSSLIVMGASTGGPKALADILSRMPADLAAGIVIAQHVDGEFSAGMARWLDEQSPLSIRLAEEGAYPSRGTALLAGKKRSPCDDVEPQPGVLQRARGHPFPSFGGCFVQECCVPLAFHGDCRAVDGNGAGRGRRHENAVSCGLAYHCPGRSDQRCLRYAQGGPVIWGRPLKFCPSTGSPLRF